MLKMIFPYSTDLWFIYAVCILIKLWGFFQIFLNTPIIWRLLTTSFQNFKTYCHISIKSSTVGDNGLTTQYSINF